MGGNIMVFTGHAEMDLELPPAQDVTQFVEKYFDGFARINMNAEEFSQVYSIPIKVAPIRLRGHKK